MSEYFGHRASLSNRGATSAIVFLAACGGATGPMDSGTGPDGGEHDEASSAAAPCSLEAGTCVASKTCCVKVGVLVNLASSCVAAEETTLSCAPNTQTTCPILDATVGCFQRTLADGTVETYDVADTTGFRTPELVECSRAIKNRVSAIHKRCSP
jgi:hypothetical protein